MTRGLVLVLTALSLAVAGPAQAQYPYAPPYYASGGQYVVPWGPAFDAVTPRPEPVYIPGPQIYVPIPVPVYLPAPVAPPPPGPYPGTYWPSAAAGTWSGCQPGDTLVTLLGGRAYCR